MVRKDTVYPNFAQWEKWEFYPTFAYSETLVSQMYSNTDKNTQKQFVSKISSLNEQTHYQENLILVLPNLCLLGNFSISDV